MRKLLSLLLVFVLFVPAAIAEDAVEGEAAIEKATFESLILDVIKKNPQIVKQALEEYEKGLSAKKEEEEFNKLLTERVEVEIGDSPVKGNKKADYTIIAFSDFQCPFCKRGDDTVKQVIEKYGDKVNYVFKHFPLSFHPEAAPASKATWAAGKQGKFYEYHDKLFEHQGELGEELYVKIAKELSLNIDKFDKDRNSEEAQKQIDQDMADGKEVGIQGTPGFILNGVKILGAYPFDHFEKVIDGLEKLKTAKK